MNKYLCLDVGNVLGRLNMTPFVNELATVSGQSHTECYRFLGYIQKCQDLGMYSLEDELKEHLKITNPSDIERLLFAWDQTLLIDHDVLSFYEDMIAANKVNVVIVSNVGIEHTKRYDRLFNNYKFIKNSIKFFSCDVGARKPTKLYYHLLLTLHPEFKGAVYVDDIIENLETGTAFGLKPFHLNLSQLTENSDELKQALDNLKNLIVNG